MALNENYNSNNQNSGKQQYNPTVYSQYRMSNINSPIDQTSLNFSFWNSTLKISIAPRKHMSNEDQIAFDNENAIAIYLNHTKARILYDEIVNFQKDPIKFNSVGVPSGQGIITISNGQEFGVDSPCLVIRKLNNEAVDSSYAYQFKTDYHYSIRNYDEKNNTFDKVTTDYNSLEIEQLKTLLLEYYTAMTGAIAYTVVDQSKYENTRMTGRIEAIAEKLGVTFNKRGNYKPNTSIFNSKPATNYTSSTLDDINHQLDGEGYED